MESGSIIQAMTVHKVYETGKVKVHALRGVDLSIQRGEMVAIIAYGASLLTTYLPARQAAKVYPAEALRFE